MLSEDSKHHPVLVTNARKKGMVHRGGGRHYLPIKTTLFAFSNRTAIPMCFSQPESFGIHYPSADKSIESLKAIAGKHSTPELIDDGQQMAPSKRIIREFPDYGDAKTVIGTQVAESIGLDVIRRKCPHFNSWLSKLERQARTSRFYLMTPTSRRRNLATSCTSSPIVGVCFLQRVVFHVW
jgi:hypothetical protein